MFMDVIHDQHRLLSWIGRGSMRKRRRTKIKTDFESNRRDLNYGVRQVLSSTVNVGVPRATATGTEEFPVRIGFAGLRGSGRSSATGPASDRPPCCTGAERGRSAPPPRPGWGVQSRRPRPTTAG